MAGMSGVGGTACPFGYTASDAAASVVRYVSSPSDASVRFPIIDISSFRDYGGSESGSGSGGGSALPPGHEQQIALARRKRVISEIISAASGSGFF